MIKNALGRALALLAISGACAVQACGAGDDGAHASAEPPAAPNTAQDAAPSDAASADAPGTADAPVAAQAEPAPATPPGRALEGSMRDLEKDLPVAGAVLYVGTLGLRGELASIGPRPVGRTDAEGAIQARDPLPPYERGVNLGILGLAPAGWGWAAVPPGGRTPVHVRIAQAAVLGLDVTVRGPDGAPLAGARVLALPRIPPFSLTSGMTGDPWFHAAPEDALEWFASTTDDAGVARFRHLPALPVLDTDVATPRNDYLLLAESAGLARGRLVTKLGDTTEQAREVRLEPLSETVLSGQVVDSTLRSVPGVRVTLAPLDVATVSDASGRYELRRPADAPLDLELVASSDSYLSTSVPLRLDGNEGVVRDVDLLVEALAPVTGRVVDDSGAGLAGARLRLHRPAGRTGAGPYDAVSDAQGAFAFPSATVGAWQLEVRPPEPAALWDAAPARTVMGGAQVEVALTRRAAQTGALRLRIVSAASGAELQPERLHLMGFHGGERSSAAIDPGARAVADLLPGSYWVWAGLADGSRGCAQVNVSAGGTAEATVSIGRRGTITGRVERLPGAGPDPAFIRLSLPIDAEALPLGEGWRGGAPTWAQLPAGRDGSFRAPGLMPGTWTVELLSDGEWAERQRVELPPGGTQHVTLTALPAGVLELRLAESPGSGFVTVDTLDVTGEWRAQTTFDGADDPPPPAEATVVPGTVRWRVRFSSGPRLDPDRVTAREATGEVTVGAGERVVVDVPVERL